MAALSWGEAELGQAVFWASTQASQAQLEELMRTPLGCFDALLRRGYKEAEAAGTLKRWLSEGTQLHFESMCTN